jgi:hypothetical protein
MLTVDRIDGLRVVIYPHDHRPAHVHILGDGCEAIFYLNCPEGLPELRENYGFSKSKLLGIKTRLAELPDLCAKWSEIHEKRR